MDSQMSTVSAGILLFLIMDPLGNIPVFLGLLKGVAPERRRRVLLRELLIALVVLFAFLLGGQYILKLLQLKQESVSIAGGIFRKRPRRPQLPKPPLGLSQVRLILPLQRRVGQRRGFDPGRGGAPDGRSVPREHELGLRK